MLCASPPAAMSDSENISQLKARADGADSLLATLKEQLAALKKEKGRCVTMERNKCTTMLCLLPIYFS